MIRIFTTLLLLSSISLSAQQLIQGEVRNALTREPIEGAIINEGLTQTDAEGRFELKIEAETEIKVSHPAFVFKSVPLPKAGKTLLILIEPFTYSLTEVPVQAYAQDRNLRSTAGAIARIDEQDFQRFAPVSFRETFNTVPGVRLDERGAGGSTRISIRGSTLRAPFGIRNLKTYWHDMPITSPDGSTPLEVMDVYLTGSTEIIKGPTSSLYGAGTGGTLIFKSPVPKNAGLQVEAMAHAGSYDLFRNGIKAGIQTSNMQLQTGWARNRADGYRGQEFVNKDLWHFKLDLYPQEKSEWSIMMLHFDGEWGLPGALTADQVAEDPRQAVAFSEQVDAHLFRKRTRIGVSHNWKILPELRNITTVYGNFTEKKNPFGTNRFFNGYKVEGAQGQGIRSRFEYDTQLGSIEARWLLGTEIQRELLTLREYTNENGQPGSLYEDSNTRSSTYSVFAQTDWTFSTGLLLTAGLSLNQVEYDYEDFFLADSIDFTNKLDFDPVWSPRLALVQPLGKALAVHASVSWGFSPPTLWEVVSPQGRIQADLQAETGINYELGFRGQVLGQLSFDVLGYGFRLQDAILPETQASGETLFFNSGSTWQDGIELSLRWEWRDSIQRPVQIRPWLTYAYQSYRFADFVLEGEDLSNNSLPGVPEHVLNAGIDLQTQVGIYAHATLQYINEIPLNNENTDFAEETTLLGLRAGYRANIGRKWTIDIYAGGANLTDELYTAFLQVNDFRGRYFNPAPARNFYGGLVVSWN